MNPTDDFTGQVALAAGASSGMGLATAQAFAEAGAAVVLANIKDQTLAAATDELTASGYPTTGPTSTAWLKSAPRAPSGATPTPTDPTATAATTSSSCSASAGTPGFGSSSTSCAPPRARSW